MDYSISADEIKKVKESLSKSGFPTEVESTAILERDGWGVINSPPYIDPFTKEEREYDIRAFKAYNRKTKSNKEIELLVYLVLECKKSLGSWTFFKTNWTSLGSGFVKKTCTPQISSLNISNDELAGCFHYGDHYKPHIVKSQIGSICFDNKDTLFEARNQVIKALNYENSRHLLSYAPKKASLQNVKIKLFYPIIVFNGHLFLATLDKNKEIDLDSRNHIHYITKSERKMTSSLGNTEYYCIDVVRLPYLNTFLTVIENNACKLADLIESKIG